MTKNTDVLIKEHERLDDLHRCGYMIIQDPAKFCFGMDAVLLSGFCNVGKGESVLDLGTGTGVIPILLAAKTKAKYLAGIELQEENADMAARSVEYNALAERVRIIHGDVTKIEDIVSAHSFDVVTANPPYMKLGSGATCEHSAKAIARHELTMSLDECLRAAAYALKFGGRLYMVHRPSRLADIMCSLRAHKLEPKQIRFIQPYADKAPNLVLIEARSGGGAELRVMPPLVVYEKDGNYTKECYEIYYQ